jgi:hypothetical protein
MMPHQYGPLLFATAVLLAALARDFLWRRKP